MRKILTLSVSLLFLIYCGGETKKQEAKKEVKTSTLDSIQTKGFVQCGVSTGTPGFSAPDDSNEWSGFDVDFCRSVSSAIFGDPSKVKFSPLNAKERFTALQSGEVDLLSRNTTWTATRDMSLGLNFAGINYYDGQGFIVKKTLGVKDAKELKGASVCLQTGTTHELNISDYSKANGLDMKIVNFDTPDGKAKGFDEGRCDVLTGDQSELYGLRTTFANPDDSIVLPNVISKEPLGPVVRQGDDKWFNLVKWTLYAWIAAEELGVTADNVDSMKSSKNPAIKRLLGVEGDFGKPIGLSKDWAYNIIKNVGNYGESFERNIGLSTPLKIKRGLNAQWKDGGLIYAMPIR